MLLLFDVCQILVVLRFATGLLLLFRCIGGKVRFVIEISGLEDRFGCRPNRYTRCPRMRLTAFVARAT